MAARKNVPYELLNAQEWGLSYEDHESYSTSEESPVADNDDVWAEKHSSSESQRKSSALEDITPHHSLDHISNQTGHRQAENNNEAWTVVASRSKAGKQQQYLTTKGKIAPDTRPGKFQNTEPKPSAPTQGRRQETVPPHRQHPHRTPGRPAKVNERRPRPQQISNFPKDNLAKASYRRRDEPTERFVLHRPIGDLEEDQSKLCQMLEELGVRSRTFICPPQNVHDKEIPIWGKPQDVARTVVDLKRWVTKVDEGEPVQKKLTAKDKFASEKSVDTNRYRSERKRMVIEAKRRAFRQNPDPAQHFPYQGWFLWRFEEVNPHGAFGLSLEAFDPIRYEHRCFIKFDERLNTIRVWADTKDRVDKAIYRIRIARLTVEAQDVKDVSIHMVTSSRKDEPFDTVMLSHHVESAGKRGLLIPRFAGLPVHGDTRSKWLDLTQAIGADNELKLTRALGKVLPSTPFYSGALQIRILFGTFGLKRFPNPAKSEGDNNLTLDFFMDNIQRPGVRSDLVTDLNLGGDARLIMEEIYGATDLLMPVSPTTEDLRDVRPSLSACYAIKRYDRPHVQYRVELKRSRGVEEMYETSQEIWNRVEGADMQKPLEATMVRLDGKLSLRFEITNQQTLHASRVDPKMSEFAKTVKLEPAEIQTAHLTGRRQFLPKRNQQGMLRPSEFDQKLAFQFRLVPAAQWILEISRSDVYEEGKNFPKSTAWSAVLFNSDWDTLTAENRGLDVGQRASWDPALSTFFPEDSSISDLLHISGKVADFLDRLRHVSAAASAQHHTAMKQSSR